MFTRKTSPILPILMVGMAMLLTGCTAQQWNQWETFASPSNDFNSMRADASSSAYPQYPLQHDTWAPQTQTNSDSTTRFATQSPAEAIQQQLAQLRALESQTSPTSEIGIPAEGHIPAMQSTQPVNQASRTFSPNSETGIPAEAHIPAIQSNQPVKQESFTSIRNTATTPATREEITAPYRILPIVNSASEAATINVRDSSETSSSANLSPDAVHDQIQKVAHLSKEEKNTLRSSCSLKCTERLIDVSGVGTVSIPTTLAAVKSIIEVRSDTGDTSATQITPAEAAAAIEANQRILSEKSKSVLDYLKSPALAPFITKLATANIQLQPIYSYKDGAQLLKGYRSLVTITFQVDMDHAPEVLSGIVERGVTSIDSVSFVPSDADLNAARMEAIKLAGIDALAQANAAIGGVGETTPLTPLQIVSLNVLGVTQPASTAMTNDMIIESTEYFPMQKAAVMAPIMVIGDQKQVRATITAKIRY